MYMLIDNYADKMKVMNKIQTWSISGTIVYLLVLIIYTHVPNEVAPEAIYPGGKYDEIGHASAYGLLAALLLVSIRHTFFSNECKSPYERRAIIQFFALPILVIITVGAIAGIDELTQPYFGRSGNWHDWFWDMAGAGCVIGGWVAMKTYVLISTRE